MSCNKRADEVTGASGKATGVGDVLVGAGESRWKPHEALKEHNINGGTVGPNLFGRIARRAAELWAEDVTLSPEGLLAAIRGEFAEEWPFDPVNLPAWRKTPVGTAVFGAALIPPNTFEQMREVACSPVVEKTALMPDGHLGYAMPIGGVAALRNAVSPSYIGYDIACRVTVTLLDLDEDQVARHRERLFDDMRRSSHFGKGEAAFEDGEARRHPVLSDPLWQEIPPLRRYHSLAQTQLGSSGGGNHFVDLGVLKITHPVTWLPKLSPGDRVAALISHSGSRGAGHKVATHYMREAEQFVKKMAVGVPQGHAWLDMNTPLGQEFWQALQVLGRYAQANHHLIHAHFLRNSGVRALPVMGTQVDLPGVTHLFSVVENHHNFAWRSDEDPGLYVHRKGATPAEAGRPGIIPGSSGSYSYLVEGLGYAQAIHSSSHGAGRPHSRSEAYRQHDDGAMRAHYEQNDILTYGLNPDETVAAYKPIEEVMAAQEALLVNSVARFQPVAVVMGGQAKADDGD